jgi:hypothetical protein
MYLVVLTFLLYTGGSTRQFEIVAEGKDFSLSCFSVLFPPLLYFLTSSGISADRVHEDGALSS